MSDKLMVKIECPLSDICSIKHYIGSSDKGRKCLINKQEKCDCGLIVAELDPNQPAIREWIKNDIFINRIKLKHLLVGQSGYGRFS